MEVVPLSPVASQIVRIVLGGQNVQLYVYQKPQGLFVDVNSNGADVEVAAIAREMTPIVSIKYTGFIGNFVFIDTQGNSDPYYSGLNSRYVLLYLTDAENELI